MVFFNRTTKEMSAKIVYYGPGLGGKTTNLQYIYDHLPERRRGKMLALPTQTDRTLFFDLLPLKIGKVSGFTTKLQLYTVPGQVFYNSTRKVVLKGVDAIVFVADSQKDLMDANIESLDNLKENLAEQNRKLHKIPYVIQYNKRDLDNIASVEELNEALNPSGVPFYESVAVSGAGVIETLKGISKLTLYHLKRIQEGVTEKEEDMEEELVIGAKDEIEKGGMDRRKEPVPASTGVNRQKKARQTSGRPYSVFSGRSGAAAADKAFPKHDIIIEKTIPKEIVVPLELRPNALPSRIKVKLNLDITLRVRNKAEEDSGSDRELPSTMQRGSK